MIELKVTASPGSGDFLGALTKPPKWNEPLGGFQLGAYTMLLPERLSKAGWDPFNRSPECLEATRRPPMPSYLEAIDVLGTHWVSNPTNWTATAMSMPL